MNKYAYLKYAWYNVGNIYDSSLLKIIESFIKVIGGYLKKNVIFIFYIFIYVS
jgi:hypothetical protein